MTNIQLIYEMAKKDNLMLLNQFKDLGINLNAQPVNGMTHLTFSITLQGFLF